jgi:3-oxo-5alpha-steroid 4-dehydrogenase
MMKHYAPRYLRGYPLGTSGDDGSGIRLGQSAGGLADRMDRVTAWRFLNPPLAWAKGIAVNQRGDRFCNEMVYGATLGIEIGDRQDGRAWLILDHKLVRQAWADIAPGKTLPFQRDLGRLNMLLGRKKTRTLAGLAGKIGVDPARLIAAVEDYARAARGEIADAQGKSQEDCAVLDTGPFMAIDIGIGAKLFPCPTLTLGGLVVNEQTGNVVRADGADIPGLYAAGRTAVGVSSNLYVSGLSIADGIFSGRRAGRMIGST